MTISIPTTSLRPEGPAAVFSNRYQATRRYIEEGPADISEWVGDRMREELIAAADDIGYDLFGIVSEVEYENVGPNDPVVFTIRANGLTRDKDALWQAVTHGMKANRLMEKTRRAVADADEALAEAEEEIEIAIELIEHQEAWINRPWWRTVLNLPPKIKDEN